MAVNNQTQVSIVNRSLLSVGSRVQVSSINPSDGSQAANVASTLYVPTFQSLARTARWNCLRAQATLTLIAAANGTPENPNNTPPFPPTPWNYMYALPTDCLAVRYIVPSLPSAASGVPPTSATIASPIYIPGGGQIPFQVAYSTDTNGNPIEVILTNQSQAQVVYTVDQPNPSIWDSMFQSAMVAALGAYFVPALSLNLPLMQASIAMAEKMINAARVADGDEGATSQNRDAIWINSRQVGTNFYGAGYGADGTTYGGYCNMAWPVGC